MDAGATLATLARSLDLTPEFDMPFRHWRPRGMLDGDAALALAVQPVDLPEHLNLETGRREANNQTRRFFDVEAQARFPAMRAVAAALQTSEAVTAWERLCDIDLAGTYLRIEYCRDGDGFWLEPHTDIGAKRITILIYLSNGDGAQDWGTDVYDNRQRLVESIPCDFNCGLVFVPGPDTWHGFHKRPISGLRRTLMANYVGPEWRARHELSFPDQPVK